MTQPTDDSFDRIGLAAALSTSYAKDALGFTGIIAALLENSLPAHTQVVRKTVRLFSSEKRVVSIKITLDDEIFSITDQNNDGQIVATKQKVVRGITLKNETLRLDHWLLALESALTESASDNQYASESMTDFLRQKGMLI